jgi:hypothetical protein
VKPVFPGTVTSGAPLAELNGHAKDTLALVVEAMLDDGLTHPEGLEADPDYERSFGCRRFKTGVKLAGDIRRSGDDPGLNKQRQHRPFGSPQVCVHRHRNADETSAMETLRAISRGTPVFCAYSVA